MAIVISDNKANRLMEFALPITFRPDAARLGAFGKS